MTLEFSVGDATKYNAIIDKNTIKLLNLDLFLKDWKELKTKAKNWNVTVSRILDEEMPVNPERLALGMDVLNQHFDSCETLEQVENQIEALLNLEDILQAVRTACNKLKDTVTEQGRPPSASQLILWNIANSFLDILEGDQSIGETKS